jgi:hypothetical protein
VADREPHCPQASDRQRCRRSLHNRQVVTAKSINRLLVCVHGVKWDLSSMDVQPGSMNTRRQLKAAARATLTPHTAMILGQGEKETPERR